MSRLTENFPGVKQNIERFGAEALRGIILFMTTFLGAYVAAHAVELLCWHPSLWRYRRVTIPIAFGLVVLSTGFLAFYSPSLITAMLEVIAVYRLVNLGRIMRGQMRPEYLKRTTLRTSIWLLIITASVVLLWAILRTWTINNAGFWIFFLSTQLVVGLLLLITTARHVRSMQASRISKWLSDKDLPTLTVAIPARNETEDLQAGLESLIASTYPKLEILVLDDCSTTKRTPEIIRSFAHNGVRFIQGDAPKDGWLAKNQAYQKLLDEANGELVLFCGADVRFQPKTLTNIVTLMLEKKKTMMSIMPRNILPRFLQLDASLIQPMRYAWEVALPRKLFRRPPVLSTCWIAKREVLLASGGFSAVSRSIVPESYFARQSVRHDGYGFRYSNGDIGLISHKALSDQRDTATRTKYPQLHRRPELVMILTLGELFGLVMPFMFFVISLFYPELQTVQLISGATCAVLVSWYLTVCVMTYRQPDLRSVLSLPFAALLDVALLNYSMLKYEFSVVNVCIPVMRVEPSLPAIDAKPGIGKPA